MKNPRTNAMWIALIAVLALLAAACGDDASDIDDAVGDEVDAVSDDLEDLGDDAEVPSEDEAEDAQESLMDALETVGLGSLSSAVENIDISELTDAAEFTFFAPDDSAFSSLSADELADLLADVDQIDDVLRNHVVPERLDAAALAERGSVTTEAGNELTVEVDGEVITVGGATVINADIEAGDGVVHVVDTLLIEE